MTHDCGCACFHPMHKLAYEERQWSSVTEASTASIYLIIRILLVARRWTLCMLLLDVHKIHAIALATFLA